VSDIAVFVLKRDVKLQLTSLRPHSWYLRVIQSASCQVHELTSLRDVLSPSWQSVSWRIGELSSEWPTKLSWWCHDIANTLHPGPLQHALGIPVPVSHFPNRFPLWKLVTGCHLTSLVVTIYFVVTVILKRILYLNTDISCILCIWYTASKY